MSRMKQLKEWIVGTIAAHPERQVNKHFLIELFGVIDYIDKKSVEDVSGEKTDQDKPRKLAYTIYPDELSDLVMSETDIAMKVAISERVRSRTNALNKGEFLFHNAVADEDGQITIFKGGSIKPMHHLVTIEGLLPYQELKITLQNQEDDE